MQQTVMQQTNY